MLTYADVGRTKETLCDRTLATVGPARPVRCNSEDAVSVKGPDAGSLCDRTLAGCVRSVLTYADVERTEEMLCDRTLAVSGQA